MRPHAVCYIVVVWGHRDVAQPVRERWDGPARAPSSRVVVTAEPGIQSLIANIKVLTVGGTQEQESVPEYWKREDLESESCLLLLLMD